MSGKHAQDNRVLKDTPLHDKIVVPTVEMAPRLCLVDGGTVIKVFPAHFAYAKAIKIAQAMACEVGIVKFEVTFKYTGDVQIMKSQKDFDNAKE